MGGLITLMLAVMHPEDAPKIVIVDALPFAAVLIDPTATPESIHPQVEAIKKQMMAIPADQYAAMQPMMAARMVKNAEAQQLVAASFAASDRAVAIEAMQEDLETDLRAAVTLVKTPTLVFYAYDLEAQQPDPATYEATVRAAYKSMPTATLARIDEVRPERELALREHEGNPEAGSLRLLRGGGIRKMRLPRISLRSILGYSRRVPPGREGRFNWRACERLTF
jgi:pimeloyl-ACP methyl ester carboxylesterase